MEAQARVVMAIREKDLDDQDSEDQVAAATAISEAKSKFLKSKLKLRKPPSSWTPRRAVRTKRHALLSVNKHASPKEIEVNMPF